MTSTNIEVGVIRENRVFEILAPSVVKDYLDELEWYLIFLLKNKKEIQIKKNYGIFYINKKLKYFTVFSLECKIQWFGIF